MAAHSFTVLARSGRARRGLLVTPHGVIETPAFVFCATKGVLRGVPPAMLDITDCQMLLASTLHLMMRPGAMALRNCGGMHRFMAWGGPIITDSGGYQAFSLGRGARPGMRRLVRFSEEGAEIRSPIDGSRWLLSPESSIAAQRDIGSDLCVALDECPSYRETRVDIELAVDRTHRWAERSLAALQDDSGPYEAGQGAVGPQILYGVTQGGRYADLRQRSGAFIRSLPFFGLAVGGMLQDSAAGMRDAIEMALHPLAGEVRPIHLLGIGGLVNIFDGVEHGVDTFDCVTPTRIARHGGALIRPADQDDVRDRVRGRINLRNARHAGDARPIMAACRCPACVHHSRAYLHHLFQIGDMAGPILVTRHNMVYMNQLFTEMRAAITAGALGRLRAEWLGE